MPEFANPYVHFLISLFQLPYILLYVLVFILLIRRTVLTTSSSLVLHHYKNDVIALVGVYFFNNCTLCMTCCWEEGSSYSLNTLGFEGGKHHLRNIILLQCGIKCGNTFLRRTVVIMTPCKLVTITTFHSRLFLICHSSKSTNDT